MEPETEKKDASSSTNPATTPNKTKSGTTTLSREAFEDVRAKIKCPYTTCPAIGKLIWQEQTPKTTGPSARCARCGKQVTESSVSILVNEQLYNRRKTRPTQPNKNTENIGKDYNSTTRTPGIQQTNTQMEVIQSLRRENARLIDKCAALKDARDAQHSRVQELESKAMDDKTNADTMKARLWAIEEKVNASFICMGRMDEEVESIKKGMTENEERTRQQNRKECINHLQVSGHYTEYEDD